MLIAEYIHAGVVEHSYINPATEDYNCADHSSKVRRESASLSTYYDMSESTGKRRKSYVDHSRVRSKLICIIHGPGNSSEECKVLGNFGSKYSIKKAWQGPQEKAFKHDEIW